MTERLDKFLSHNGFGSRRDIKKLVGARLVSINEETASSVTQKIDVQKDKVCVDGTIVKPQSFMYLMLNKPAGTVSVKTEGEHQTVFELLDDNLRTPFFMAHLHCIGRLDVDTEGLLILTTDGKLTHRITSPKTHSPKKYFVQLRREVDTDAQKTYAEKFAQGIHIEQEGKELAADCKPAELEWKTATECFLTITEGKYHQVKRMFLAIGNEVVYLKRVAIGELQLDETLLAGEYRELTEEEVAMLYGDEAD